MQPWEEPARQLPVTLPPVGGETVGSYLNRLALANRLRVAVLARSLAPYRRAPSAIDDDTSAWTPHHAAAPGGHQRPAATQPHPGAARTRATGLAATATPPAGSLPALHGCSPSLEVSA